MVSSNTLRFESLGPSISVIERGSNESQDNDGDDLVDCADPECHEGDGNDVLEPFPNDGANVCHTNTCPATLHVDLNGFWQFEETLLDNSENDNELSMNGDPKYTDYIRGSLGQAMAFDGAGDYLSVADD